MSQTAERPLYMAERAVDDLIPIFKDACDRLEVVGSIRRRREAVGDIELLCVPRFSYRRLPGTMFPDAVNELEVLADRIKRQEIPALRRRGPQHNRAAAWGPRWKSLAFWNHGRAFAVDLFICSRLTWGILQALRTGPAEFSQLLVSSRTRGGAMPPYPCRIVNAEFLTPQGSIPCVSEEDFFTLLQIPFYAPEARSAGNLRKWLEANPPPADHTSRLHWRAVNSAWKFAFGAPQPDAHCFDPDELGVLGDRLEELGDPRCEWIRQLIPAVKKGEVPCC